MCMNNVMGVLMDVTMFNNNGLHFVPNIFLIYSHRVRTGESEREWGEWRAMRGDVSF